MRKHRLFATCGVWTAVLALVTTLVVPVWPTTVHADRGVVDLWKAIKPLTTIASAMNTGAHPDDEHSAMLAYLSLGKGVDTSSIIANRGEGGQNEIGSELDHALGVIRTRELQEASRITNVTLGILSQEIDDPIYDFGFSKSPEETLQKWGESVVYERLIRKIRELRPDVLIPAFRNEPSTHGHHRAINVITVKAFADAANPAVFPEHVQQGLSPWQVKKLYLPATAEDYTVRVPVGEYDEIYGASYLQLGEESRFMHKSQGMGRHYEEGPSYSYYKLAQAVVPGKEKERDFFDGIAYTFADLAGETAGQPGGQGVAQHLRQLQQSTDRVIAAFPRFTEVAREVHSMGKVLQETIAAVQTSSLPEGVKTDLLHRLRVKEGQWQKASAEAVSFVGRVKPDAAELIPGQTTKVTVTAYHGSHTVLQHIQFRLRVPDGWQVKPLGPTNHARLGYNQTASADFQVTVPANSPYFHPYRPPALTAEISYEAFGSVAVQQVSPANPVAVLPPFALSLSPDRTILNTRKAGEPIPFKVTVRNYSPGPADTAVTLQAPAGWRVEPATAPVVFAAKGEAKSVSFTVTPAAQVAEGTYTLTARAVGSAGESREGAQVIQYPHIGRTYLVQPAQLAVQAFPLEIPEDLKVGYVSSGFDQIDQYLEQLGIDVTRLSAKEIESGDLNQYDTIILGIRAYGFRPELIPSNNRLLQYVKEGGNLVVQYHKPEDKWKPELAPYPITIGTPLIQWRVTDENSPVRVLAPDHPIFNTPNRITEKDWENWVQDRSAYNPANWGEEYVELIANGDPGEQEFTGTFLTAEYGKGTYTYSSLVWYREIPALVPGAIRLFVNMISLKQP